MRKDSEKRKWEKKVRNESEKKTRKESEKRKREKKVRKESEKRK